MAIAFAFWCCLYFSEISISNGEIMKYNDVINHSSIKNYFGANSEEWIDSLNSLVEKKEIGEMHVDDPDARKLLSNTYKFSFFGFIFNYLWAAYHNTKGWIYFCIGYLILQTIDLFFLEGVASTVILIAISMYFGFAGKSLLLQTKSDELCKTGNLTSHSWARVAVAFVIVTGGIFAAVIISESINL
jgi:hypothetical protein